MLKIKKKKQHNIYKVALMSAGLCAKQANLAYVHIVVGNIIYIYAM